MVTDIFAVIADQTRRDILQELRGGDKAVGELVEALDASQPTVSKHLKVLRDAGLVTTRAQGQKRFYGLRLEPLAEVGGWLTSLRTTAPPAVEIVGAPAAVAGGVPAGAAAFAAAGPGDDSETRPQQLQRTVERTVERAAKGAAEIIANLPKWRRREAGRQQG
ncbi:metalloregulator ArsR/SmtB family transcription factor [Sinomonas sp. JGH33]|uniref:Metalloregulator ArsR/SmtB family transcription factor n=1 Tax=Sinomonas terricola TaxID=3110330 RepID=A0ABU5T2A7_9MICC|nr:metalloregulator ArsR/SmtB family transcription factor [Sinomonas sp. JGH33]MEA5453775.1 metalloregulator ArsR/SmtB family transcription factor [Sinomonas sp. JGH33]